MTSASTRLHENWTNEDSGPFENQRTADQESDNSRRNVGRDTSLIAAVSSGRTDRERVSRRKIVEMKTISPDHDDQLVKYQRSLEFLRSQHQELVGNLHEEIDRLKRKNRGLLLKVLFLLSCMHDVVD